MLPILRPRLWEGGQFQSDRLLNGASILPPCAVVSEQARPLLAGNEINLLVDPRLEGRYDDAEMERMVSVAALCVRHSSGLRPRMGQVRGFLLLTMLLQGDTEWAPVSLTAHAWSTSCSCVSHQAATGLVAPRQDASRVP